jgi:hypothetical protein
VVNTPQPPVCRIWNEIGRRKAAVIVREMLLWCDVIIDDLLLKPWKSYTAARPGEEAVGERRQTIERAWPIPSLA